MSELLLVQSVQQSEDNQSLHSIVVRFSDWTVQEGERFQGRRQHLDNRISRIPMSTSVARVWCMRFKHSLLISDVTGFNGILSGRLNQG